VTLGEVIERLEGLDPDATIYVAKPWSVGSRTVVAQEPGDGSTPRGAVGLDYFLEVAVAVEAALVSETGTWFERVLHYAENDAFLFDG
jgi:hypothetical protein